MAFFQEVATAVSPIKIAFRNIVGIITESIPSEAKERTPGDLWKESTSKTDLRKGGEIGTSLFRVPGIQADAIMAKMHIGFATTLLIAVVTFRYVQVILTSIYQFESCLADNSTCFLLFDHRSRFHIIMAFALLANIGVNYGWAAVSIVKIASRIIQFVMTKPITEGWAWLVRTFMLRKSLGWRHQFPRIVQALADFAIFVSLWIDTATVT